MIKKWQEMSKFWYSMNKFGNPAGMPTEQRIRHGRDLCNGLFMEVAELQDSFQWKPWREGIEVDKENLKREIVDCLFFLHHIGCIRH